ncbi:hypothetical protein CC80DRAFT_597897 [Byssothecium circinans]|uniref:C2H2-type domain-containing protein n=1 Tax=Byssothecium circinans TaxID=147558 RepID=A0A6A5TGQ4_9PLEO|nr:hypothetical protein CC80DRAFT_597897 [Byssothecium circinans]
MGWYRAIAEGNWKRPLDVSLPSTHHGELRIPFSRDIYQPNATTKSGTSFPFSKLPVELQLRVLHLCDKPTLFQLMQTARCTRNEAKKLFFSRPEWYHIDADWLVKGGHPGDTICDMDFLACIQRLEVDFFWMSEMTWMNKEDCNVWQGTEEEAVAGACGVMDEHIRDFWRTVQHRFPRAKHIVLSDDCDRVISPKAAIRLPPDVFKKVGQMCPHSINVSICLVQRDGCFKHRMKRKLWRLRRVEGDVNATEKWEECPTRSEPSIIPPHKVFRGPVGKFQDCRTKIEEAARQRWAIRVHRIAAMEKCHFYRLHEPFRCSTPDCQAWFEQPEEYTSHAIETGHDKNDVLPGPFEGLRKMRRDWND